MSATLPILSAFKERLIDQVLGYEVQLFPDKPQEYRFIHPNGAILIGYESSKFAKPEATELVVQQRVITVALTVFARNLHNDNGALAMLDSIRLALTGWRPPNCLPIQLGDERFLDETGGTWQYQLRLQTETQQIEQREEPVRPSLKTLTATRGG